MMRFTHPANGGKLNEIVCPRGTLSFWLRHNRQTAMSRRVDRAHRYSLCARSTRRDIAVCRLCRSQKDKVPRGQTISFSFPPFAGWVKRIILTCTVIYLFQAVMGRFAPIVVVVMREWLALIPLAVMHGKVWQVVTYS